MKKLKDIRFQKGDIIEFTNGDTMIIYGFDGDIASKLNTHSREVKQIKRPIQYKTIYEAPHEILDKEEKEYLENVIRPFKEKTSYIVKRVDNFNTKEEYLLIDVVGGVFAFPNFKKGTMYKGMEVDKEYTLEELGLFK